MAYKNRWNSYSDNFGHHEPCAYGNRRRMGERTNISKGGSISVPSYGNSRQNRGTNNAKKLGSVERVRRRKRMKKSREYRYVVRQLRACSPACTVQQKNREGNQPSHFGRGLINQFQMGVPNGELVVMYTTSSYHMY